MEKPSCNNTIKSNICRRNPFRCIVVYAFLLIVCSEIHSADFNILKPSSFAHHIERFNAMDDEIIKNAIPNAGVWAWLQENIPLFDCPDRVVEEIYYFRWWSFRKHLVQTPTGWVITEFLPPVRHAGKHNTISCAAGFHIAEGRWLRNNRYVNDYIEFWLRGNSGKPQPHFHNYSSWFAAAIWDRFLVDGDKTWIIRLLDDLVADYHAWEEQRLLPSGLFWQYDVRDGMEESISGSRTLRNERPTINSYMYANARAISEIARLAENQNIAAVFARKAEALQKLVQATLWDSESGFFKVRLANGRLSDAREAIGFIPWMFHLPVHNQGFELAWAQLKDAQGFAAPYGITTAERRHPQFRTHGVGTCEWDGAVWPFATTQILYALANVIRDYPQKVVSRQDYFNVFLNYTRSQYVGNKPYIGEYQDEVTGDWINGKNDRSRYYNHSMYGDSLISGVVGLRPRADALVEIDPLLPSDTWDWFCLDGVKYHGHLITLVWDKDGSRYNKGAGFRLLVDGKEIARSDQLVRLTGKLP